MPSSRFRTPRACLALIVVFLFALAIDAQTSAFTYQGRLTDTSTAASGTYQMQFALYDALTGGMQIGATIENTAVTVNNGVFTVQLDYGAAAFPGAERFLEISVRRNSSDSYVVLVPRQRVTSGPYSIRASNAGAADSLSSLCVLCVTDSQIASISGSKVSGQVASAANADSSLNVTGVVAIANGGTGSSTKNFVDLTTNQTVAGNKTFTGAIVAQNPNANTDAITGINSATAGTGSGAGVFGVTNQAGAAGVWGENNNTNGTGIVAAGNNQTAITLIAGSGLAATGFTTGVYSRTTNPGASQVLYTDNFGSITRVNYWNGTTQFKINGTGTVSTLVRDDSNQKRVMFAPEAPEVLLEDYGSGQLVNGRSRIDIDPVFARNITVNERHPLKVFIQLEGDCNGVYVTNKTASGFEVIELAGGKSNVKFSWHIVGNRADEELGNERQSDGTVTPSRTSRYADLRFPVQEGDLRTASGVAEQPATRTTLGEKKPN